MPTQEKVTDIKALIIWGAFAYLLIGVFIVWILAKVFLTNDPDSFIRAAFPNGIQYPDQQGQMIETPPARPEEAKRGGLGSEGSVCGGPNRLPCMPGLQCVVTAGESTGLCATSPANGQ